MKPRKWKAFEDITLYLAPAADHFTGKKSKETSLFESFHSGRGLYLYLYNTCTG